MSTPSKRTWLLAEDLWKVLCVFHGAN